MSYFNSALFITYCPDWHAKKNGETTASPLSAAWLQIYGVMIFSTTLTTNLTPYIAVVFDIISQRMVSKRTRSERVF
jgi:hypothetical protein